MKDFEKPTIYKNVPTYTTDHTTVNSPVEAAVMLPIGTKIKFLKDLGCGPCEDHPAFTFAKEGDYGVVTGHNCREGHLVKWEKWMSAAFGAELGTDFIRA